MRFDDDAADNLTPLCGRAVSRSCVAARVVCGWLGVGSLGFYVLCAGEGVGEVVVCVFGKRWQEVLIIWLVNWLKHHALDRNYGAGWIVWWLMTAIDLKLHHLGF